MLATPSNGLLRGRAPALGGAVGFRKEPGSLLVRLKSRTVGALEPFLHPIWMQKWGRTRISLSLVNDVFDDQGLMMNHAMRDAYTESNHAQRRHHQYGRSR